MLTDLMPWSAFDRFWALDDLLDRQLERWSRPFRRATAMPAADVATDDEGWRIQVALPGVPPENVEVSVAGRTIHVRAIERDGDTPFTRYEQMVMVPDTVDPDAITATLRHGLLELTLPLKEALKPRRIAITTDAPKQLTAA